MFEFEAPVALIVKNYDNSKKKNKIGILGTGIEFIKK